MTTERTPQDVLREVRSDVLGVLGEIGDLDAPLNRIGWAQQLREALDKAVVPDGPPQHVLSFPPHPDGFYIGSALCSCGAFQWDAENADDLRARYQDVLADWNEHALIDKAIAEAPDSPTGHWRDMTPAQWDAASKPAPDTLSEKLGLDAPSEEHFVRLASAVTNVRDFLALHRRATGRSDVNIRKVLRLLDDALGSTDSEGR